MGSKYNHEDCGNNSYCKFNLCTYVHVGLKIQSRQISMNNVQAISGFNLCIDVAACIDLQKQVDNYDANGLTISGYLSAE